jgi:hypothetical protein|tara:strand:- start:664 stop:846 length:183 start_codon:yes stop_codon:yes gene_type:complete
METSKTEQIQFAIDEVLRIKGVTFKVVLIDACTGKLALKQISEEEAQLLKAQAAAQTKTS